ncbi:MAG: FAD-dependent oxidoreductase [Bacteroidetes bacterium]|nr:FAD-dependent oxidoreductase [Bacteroidota bacterium]
MRNWIKKRLQNYQIPLNQVDFSLPKMLKEKKRVAVVGGGIAGIASAAALSERGFAVSLFERENFLGGKVGSWEFESKGERLRTEHGFHAFFRQYYNLLAFLKEIGADKHLISIDDYVLLYENKQKQGFKEVETTPGLNIIDLKKHGIFGWTTLLSPFSMPFLHLLRFDFKASFKRFDQENFAQFARRTFMPKKMQLVFNSFARAFFAEPENMSMAELIKGFHFYFLSNDKGLIYEVLDNDFQFSFIDYCIQFLEKNGVDLRLNTPLKSLEYKEQSFIINDENFDYCILCTDVNATKTIIEQASGLDSFRQIKKEAAALKNSGNYAVLRLWTDHFEEDKNLPFFIFTDRLKCLDSVTLYHKMEKESIAWSEKNQGGIFELHSYAVPIGMTKEACREHLLLELYHYFPELEGMEIKHEYFQFRNDFSAFHTSLYENRPKTVTEVAGLYFAGDWVKMDNCAMLMEGAYVSGVLAANHIMSKEGLQEKALVQVPPKGLLR